MKDNQPGPQGVHVARRHADVHDGYGALLGSAALSRTVVAGLVCARSSLRSRGRRPPAAARSCAVAQRLAEYSHAQYATIGCRPSSGCRSRRPDQPATGASFAGRAFRGNRSV